MFPMTAPTRISMRATDTPSLMLISDAASAITTQMNATQ
jgi:hypothetical protein